MKLLMDDLFIVVATTCVVVCTVLLLAVSHYRRMRTLSIQRDREHALERDAIQLAKAKLKFRNILGKQGQNKKGDPLMDLYGVEVPTDCRPSQIQIIH